MDRTACTEPQCLYKGDLYLYLFYCLLPPSSVECINGEAPGSFETPEHVRYTTLLRSRIPPLRHEDPPACHSRMCILFVLAISSLLIWQGDFVMYANKEVRCVTHKRVFNVRGSYCGSYISLSFH